MSKCNKFSLKALLLNTCRNYTDDPFGEVIYSFIFGLMSISFMIGILWYFTVAIKDDIYKPST